MKKFIAISGAVLLGSVSAHFDQLMDIDQEIHQLGNDVSTIKGHLQQTIYRRVDLEDDVEVEAPLFGRGGRSRPTHPSGGHSGLSNLEKLKYSTDIIGTLGTTGAQLYADIEAGRASQAEIDYYNQQMNQPQVEAFRRSSSVPTLRRQSGFRIPENEEERMHPLEKFKLSTDIIGTLGTTGAQLYADIEAGRASEAEKAYYESLMNQPQVERGTPRREMPNEDYWDNQYRPVETFRYNQLQVETPLFSSRRRTPTVPRRPTRPIREPIEEPTAPRMHPLEKLKMSTDIITGLGVTGAQLYSNIQAGRASQAQIEYYNSLMAQQQQQPQVEALRRTPTRRPPSMHPLEKLKLSTDIISGLGITGAQMYQNIQAGRASAAEIAYYNQLSQQPQVESYLDDAPNYVYRNTRQQELVEPLVQGMLPQQDFKVYGCYRDQLGHLLC